MSLTSGTLICMRAANSWLAMRAAKFRLTRDNAGDDADSYAGERRESPRRWCSNMVSGRARLLIGSAALKAVPWNAAGRKPAPQQLTLDWGVPRGSGMATYAGRLSFSLPSA